ncbi:uncharacterized protein HD556DRAFT_1302317 [Suillus plorans]|uniref:Uncharacterized protein n=1 Tax=Suillus plorans TaxID=116603 RepID=A0A9P7E2R1_9AGAM|nr:uncharacterized protein HD556DRAFT_1302317 [Suillus plorans]KAG1809902.1 hypothetical protein HD556DRAFT_1302317 [Suillus plorans]
MEQQGTPTIYHKTVHQIIKDLKNSFTWECVVVGDLFAGYCLDDKKHYAGALTKDSLLEHAKKTYLWLLYCGAIVNNSDLFVGLQYAVVHYKLSTTITFNTAHFQQSFVSHLLLAFTKQVLMECCPIGLAFGDMLGQAYKLGCHADVLLLTPLEGSLQVSKFVWADVDYVGNF